MNLSKTFIKRIMAEVPSDTTIGTETYNDSEWYTGSTYASLIDTPDFMKTHLYRTVAESTFTDTSFGGHIVVNPPYGFTSYADVSVGQSTLFREKDYVEKPSVNIGMGRYYAEAIDNNMHTSTLYLTPGRPNFTSFLGYYMNAVDYGKLVASRGGSLLWYNLGRAYGAKLLVTGALGRASFFTRFFFRYSWFMIGLTALSTLKELALGFNDSNYYSMTPTPHTHLMSANAILAGLVAERGFIHPIVPNITKHLTKTYKPDEKKKYGSPVFFDGEDTKELQRLMPSLFKENGMISLPAYIARPMVKYLEYRKATEALLESRVDKALSGQGIVLFKKDDRPIDSGDWNPNSTTVPTISFEEHLKHLNDIGQGAKIDAEIQSAVNKLTDNDKIDTTSDNTDDVNDFKFGDAPYEADGSIKTSDPDIKNAKDKAITALETQKVIVKDGLSQIAFHVDYQGGQSDTFSNTFKDIPAKSALNTVTGAVRDIRFNFSDGNIVNDAVTKIIGSARDVAMGVATEVTAGISNVVAGTLLGAYFDMPQMWNDSNTQLHSHTFKMTLGGPYGNPLSLVRDIDIPLSLLLAFALPNEVGRSAYTSPFLTSAFMRGGCNIKLGMFKSLTIKRSTGGLKHTRFGVPLQLEVSFEIVDLEPMLRAPISNGLFGALDILADEQNAVSRYIGVIAGRSYHSDKFRSRRAVVKASASLFGASVVVSPESLTLLAMDNMLGRFITALNTDESLITAYDNN